MDAYRDVIEQEQAKLAILKKKVEACEQRIALFKSLAESDDIDVALASAVGRASAPPGDAPGMECGPQQAGGAEGAPVLRKESAASDVLSFLAQGEKSLDEVVNHLEHIGRRRSRDYLRTALMNWRKKQGWVVNPRPGRYGLSEKGMLYVSTQKGEGPGE